MNSLTIEVLCKDFVKLTYLNKNVIIHRISEDSVAEINVTHLTKEFGKTLDSWRSSTENQNFEKELENLQNSSVLRFFQSAFPHWAHFTDGHYAHPLLAMQIAAWIGAECIKIVYEITKNSLGFSSSIQNFEFMEKKKEIERATPSKFCALFKVLGMVTFYHIMIGSSRDANSLSDQFVKLYPASHMIYLNCGFVGNDINVLKQCPEFTFFNGNCFFTSLDKKTLINRITLFANYTFV